MNMTQGSGGENYSDGVENSRRLFLIEMTVLAASATPLRAAACPRGFLHRRKHSARRNGLGQFL